MASEFSRLRVIHIAMQRIVYITIPAFVYSYAKSMERHLSDYHTFDKIELKQAANVLRNIEVIKPEHVLLPPPSRNDPLLYTRWASKLGKVRQKQTKIWAKWERKRRHTKARKLHILWTILYGLG